MERYDMEVSGRTLRWYEWLMFLILMGLAAGVRAAPIYKCTNARGEISFQDQRCAAVIASAPVTLDPAPKYVASPVYAVDSLKPALATPRGRTQSMSSNDRSGSRAQSYECRSTDGQVFYRHTSCPHSIAAAAASATKGRGHASAGSVAVTAIRVSREEACSQMRRAGAIGRSGHGYDEDVSTYDKNLGRDPCH